MTRQIYLADIDSQSLGNFLCRPFLAYVAIKDLKLFRLDLPLYARDRCFKQILFPLRLPDRIKIDDMRIGNALDRRRWPIIRCTRAFRIPRFTFAKLICDSPARNL